MDEWIEFTIVEEAEENLHNRKDTAGMAKNGSAKFHGVNQTLHDARSLGANACSRKLLL